MKSDWDILWEKINDTVTFYCPDCGEMLTVLHHIPYICGCGKKWLTAAPECDSATAIREVNGKEG